MLSPKFPQVLRYLLIALVPTVAILVAGCPFGGAADQTGSNGESPGGQPVPPDDFQLDVIIEGQGKVEQAWDGKFITLTAIPDTGWRFDRWFGTTASKHNPLTVQVTEDTSIGARFLESESQADTDGDGVPDGLDQCPDTPSGAEADENGCAASQQDSDGDGVTDDSDQCPGTATGSVIDGQGCAANQRDSDGDGVKDDVDRCSNTSAGASVDALGCSEGQRDNDGDGVANDLDQCPGTASGTAVDNVGCPLCGNGVVDAGEECDNGSANSDTAPNACRTNCTSHRCGDGVVDAGEECEPPGTSTCNSTCKFIRPANDDCDDPISVGDGSKSFSNERASTDGPDDGGECAGLERDVWYCYTASCDGTAKVSLCTSNFDTVMAVYTGCACPTTNPVVCDDDGCGSQGGGSQATFTVSKNGKYLIRVGGFNGATGSGTMTISCQSAGPQCQSNSDCDDGVFCNGAETCVGGNCQGGSAPCTDAAHCDEDNDVCLECLAHEECDDDDLCTNDTCVDNECQNIAVQCGAGQVCDPGTGQCVQTCSDDPDCDDGLFCNGAETCVNEMCKDGTAPCIDQAHCDEDNDLCLDCISSGECDDGDLCTDDECIDNECQYTDKECPQGEYCNPATGICVECLSADHCDDGDKCTVDTCQLNVCQHTDVDCGTSLVCDPDTGDCVECLVADDCDDGDLCTVDDCVDKVCENNPVQCGPNEECDPATGECVTVCDSNDDCDDGLFCNGQEVCVERTCTTLDPPCIDDAHCDEGNDVCLECLSVDECDDDDLCTDDACISNECWNIDVQCAPGVCNPDTGECVECLVNADCQNGLFCDGDEWCSPALECQTGEDPCDDGIGCTIDICYELNDRCENAATDARCPDDGLFCNGDEYCNPVFDCTSTGNPCQADEICNEELDRCEVEPATWVSTQLLFPGFPGYKAPESHELDGLRDLVVAHLGLSEAELLLLFDEVTVYTTSVLIGVETTMYLAVNSLLEESTEQRVTITTFHLSVRGSTATWEFDYIVVDYMDDPFGESVTSRHFYGTQTGDITGARDEITWTSVDGSFQHCTDGNCGPEKPLDELIPTGDWTLGTWTKQE